jgi:hypothetical protein
MKIKMIKSHHYGGQLVEGKIINTSESQALQLIEAGFAEKLDDSKEEKPKRKRRTKAQIEADNAKSDL